MPGCGRQDARLPRQLAARQPADAVVGGVEGAERREEEDVLREHREPVVRHVEAGECVEGERGVGVRGRRVVMDGRLAQPVRADARQGEPGPADDDGARGPEGARGRPARPLQPLAHLVVVHLVVGVDVRLAAEERRDQRVVLLRDGEREHRVARVGGALCEQQAQHRHVALAARLHQTRPVAGGADERPVGVGPTV